eukprot:6207120-Pleurochrysis_carterae.AAC.1
MPKGAGSKEAGLGKDISQQELKASEEARCMTADMSTRPHLSASSACLAWTPCEAVWQYVRTACVSSSAMTASRACEITPGTCDSRRGGG